MVPYVPFARHTNARYCRRAGPSFNFLHFGGFLVFRFPATFTRRRLAVMREGMRDIQDIVVTLVSVAIGEPYETSLRRMGATASAAGFNKTLLWKAEDFLSDPAVTPRHRQALERMQRMQPKRKKKHPWDRPYCGAFKSFALHRALQQSREGDYVLWADASKYHDARYRDVSVREAIQGLTGMSTPRRPARLYTDFGDVSAAYAHLGWFKNRTREPRRTLRSAYGVMHCAGVNCDQQLFLPNTYRNAVNRATLAAFPEHVGSGAEAIAAMSRRPHIMNANILLENTPFNRRLMQTWMEAAVTKPDEFCASSVQEQSVFSILIMGAKLPLVNACPYMRIDGFNRCQDTTKSSRWFLETLSNGAFEVATPAEIDEELVPAYQDLHARAQRGLLADANVPGRKPGTVRPMVPCCRSHAADEPNLTRAFGDQPGGFDCCRLLPCAAPRYVAGLCAFVRKEPGSLLP